MTNIKVLNLIFSSSVIEDQPQREPPRKATVRLSPDGNREEPKDMCTSPKVTGVSETRVNRAITKVVPGTTSVRAKVTATEKGSSQVSAARMLARIVAGVVEQPLPSISFVSSVFTTRVPTEATRSTT